MADILPFQFCETSSQNPLDCGGRYGCGDLSFMRFHGIFVLLGTVGRNRRPDEDSIVEDAEHDTLRFGKMPDTGMKPQRPSAETAAVTLNLDLPSSYDIQVRTYAEKNCA